MVRWFSNSPPQKGELSPFFYPKLGVHSRSVTHVSGRSQSLIRFLFPYCWTTALEMPCFVAHCSTSTAIKLPLQIRSDDGFSLLIVDSAALSREPAKKGVLRLFNERPINGRRPPYLSIFGRAVLSACGRISPAHPRKRTCQDL